MRLVIDSDKFESISEYNWPHKIGYVNGRESAWTPAQIKAAQAKGELLALVDVLGNAPHQAAILDFERGDVQDPAALLKWMLVRNEFRNDGVVYCNRSSLPAVINALRGIRWRLWLADPSADNQPPMTPPRDIVLPANAELLGIQYALAPHSGGHYDMSIFYDDSWHATAAAAHVDQAPDVADLEQGADVTEQAQAVEAPAAAAASAPVRPVPASALSTAAAAAAAPVQPVAILGPDGRDSGQTEFVSATRPDVAQAPEAEQLAAAEPETGPGYDHEAHTADSQAAAAAVSQGDPGRLPHSWIGRVLIDLRRVAQMFSEAGATEVGQLLDQAARHGTETGVLLQKAGK